MVFAKSAGSTDGSSAAFDASYFVDMAVVAGAGR